MIKKPWTPKDDAKLTELREAGHSITETARRMSRSRGSVSCRMYRLGMCETEIKRRWSAEEIDHLIDHYRDPEWPVQRLAERYGRTPAAVRMRAANLGIQRPDLDYKTKPAEVDQRIVTLAMADLPSQEIAEQVGCSAAYVWVVMKKRPHLHQRWKKRLGRRRRTRQEMQEDSHG